MLFTLIMDKIIENMKPMTGYKLTKYNVNIVCYADDTLLIADIENNLQRLLFKFNELAEIFNMKMPTEKTKALIVSKESVKCKLEIKNKILELIISFTYLGIEITRGRNAYKELRKQVMKTARTSGYLRDVIWNSRYLRIESKKKVYKTMVRPVMTYAAETGVYNSKTKQHLRITEGNTLRTMLAKTRKDRIRN